MKTLGFRFQETMSGTYTLTGKPDEQREISFTVKAHAESALRHLRDGMTHMQGTLDMEGFADDVPIDGTIEIAPVLKRIIRYEFRFAGNDGEPYRFAGQKEIRLSDLIGTWTNLTASVTDASGKEVARARMAFDLKADLLPFLASWKPALAF
jgi:hypothetical protein